MDVAEEIEKEEAAKAAESDPEEPVLKQVPQERTVYQLEEDTRNLSNLRRKNPWLTKGSQEKRKVSMID